jgi:hypothetical protein
MLDFEKLAKPRKVIVPVRDRSFLFEKRRFSLQADDGWHLVEIENRSAKMIEQVSASNLDYPSILGYTHNNSIIFQNFDVAKRKYGLGLNAPLYFNRSSTFEPIKAIVWEDRQVYWCAPNYADAKALELKDLAENSQDINGQIGITPELRTTYLFHAIEKESLRKILQETKQKEELDRLMASIPGRLKVTFDRVGAELVNYSLSGDRIVVDWKIKGSYTEYNSIIDSRTWMVVEAGYCMSGDDRRHNVTSLVKTAQEYEERRVTFITRRNEDDNWD